MHRLMKARTKPTALVVSSVNAGIGALSALSRLGVRVPEDLSVVAINDTWVAETWTPPLTTVRMPLRTLGRRACSMLFDHLEGAPLTDVVITTPAPELIVRGSTRPL